MVSPYQPGNNLVTLSIDCAEVLAGVILDILMKEEKVARLRRLLVSVVLNDIRVPTTPTILTGKATFVSAEIEGAATRAHYNVLPLHLVSAVGALKAVYVLDHIGRALRALGWHGWHRLAPSASWSF